MEDIGGAEDDWLKPEYVWVDGQSDYLECHLNGNFLGPQGVHQDVFYDYQSDEKLLAVKWQVDHSQRLVGKLGS